MRDTASQTPHFTGIIPVVADQSDWNFFNSKPPRGGQGWGVILLACCASKALLLTRKLEQQLRDSLTGLRQAALRQFVCESG
jgi:hypothetical protein